MTVCLISFFSGEGGTTLDVEFYSPPCDDIDSDEICDDVDDCVGDYDECGVCNGNGTSCPDTPQNLIAIGGLNQIILNWSPVLTQYDQNLVLIENIVIQYQIGVLVSQHRIILFIVIMF